MSANCMTIMIDQCLRLDTHATRLYRQLSEQAGNPDLKVFWQTIARQNEQYLGYWENLFDWAAKGLLDNLFAAPQQTLDELTALQEKVRCLADVCSAAHQKEKAFTMAFKLEFYLLHPAIEMLGQYMATFNGAKAADGVYERFVGRLFDALQQHDLGTLELELVGDAIHRLWKENRRMAFLSNYDELTGIFNRRGLFNAIHHLAHLSQRNDNTVGVLMIDIDHFKVINDTFGHPFGDRILQRVAGCIRDDVRAADVLGRYGGEEFLVFLSRVDPVALGRIGEKIRKSIGDLSSDRLTVTVSIGISHGHVGRDVEKSIRELIKTADEKLLTAKASGRNRIVS
mgnify:CR=1 FL=1